MRIKKYRGTNVRILKARIRRELGDDAVILSTRTTVEGGILGFFGKRVLEMVAALPEEEEKQGQCSNVDLTAPREIPRRWRGGIHSEGERAGLPQMDDEKHGRDNTPEATERGLKNGWSAEQEKQADRGSIIGRTRVDGKAGSWREEWRSDESGSISKSIGNELAMRRSREGSETDLIGLSERAAKVCGKQEGQGRQLIDHIADSETSRSSPEFTPLRISLRKTAEERSTVKAIILGPPGAGKTTCIGRMAYSHRNMGDKVTVFSLEEEGRLSGADRWHLFWEILGVDYQPILSLEELAKKARSISGVVLVDTPPMKRTIVDQWCGLAQELFPGFERYFVFDACMENEEFLFWLKMIEAAAPYGLIISKADQIFASEKVEKMIDTAHATRIYIANSESITDPFHTGSHLLSSLNRFCGEGRRGARPGQAMAITDGESVG